MRAQRLDVGGIQRGEFRQDDAERTGLLQPRDPARGVGGDEQLVELHLPALAGDVLKLCGALSCGACRVVGGREVEACGEARGAQEAQRVVAEDRDRLFVAAPGHLERALSDGALPVEGVDDRAVAVHGHRVDREVAADEVFLEVCPEADDGVPAPVLVELPDPVGRDLDGHVAHHGGDRSELLAERDGAEAGRLEHALRLTRGRAGGEVDVADLVLLHHQVAHTSADEDDLEAVGCEGVEELLEGREARVCDEGHSPRGRT